MPSGVHSGPRGYYPRTVCDCKICKNCKQREYRKKTGRTNEPSRNREDYGEQFERKVDKEPSFDALTERLIEKFRMRGWD